MISWGNLISALKRPFSLSLFTNPGKEGLGDRLHEGHKNCRLQGALGMGKQEAVFCIKINVDRVHKFQIPTMLLMPFPDSVSQKLNPLVWT